MASVRKTRESKAEHYWIGPDGVKVDEIEHATGVRYVSKENGGVVDWQIPGASAGSPATMLACFGARTLATNEASAARNGAGEGPEGQLQAIRDRFALIASGTFVDRSREGGGFRINLDALAAAVVDVMVRAKKVAKENTEATVAKVRANLEAKDKSEHSKALNVPGVRDAYARHMGKAVATVDDLSAELLG